MERPKDSNDSRTMIERASVKELMELAGLADSPSYNLLTSMFKERLEAVQIEAFDLNPAGSGHEKAIEHYGKRKEIEYQYNVLKDLKTTCNQELKKRDEK